MAYGNYPMHTTHINPNKVVHNMHGFYPPGQIVSLIVNLRARGHTFMLLKIKTNCFKKSFINRCLFNFI